MMEKPHTANQITDHAPRSQLDCWPRPPIFSKEKYLTWHEVRTWRSGCASFHLFLTSRQVPVRLLVSKNVGVRVVGQLVPVRFGLWCGPEKTGGSGEGEGGGRWSILFFIVLLPDDFIIMFFFNETWVRFRWVWLKMNECANNNLRMREWQQL